MSSRLKQKLDSINPIIIIFHPGSDPCNSSGTSKPKDLKKWYNSLEKKILKISNSKPIYLYKNKSGLEDYAGLIAWEKDPNAYIEYTFFRYHYPCSSFVVISSSGKYQAGFGEFSQEAVIKVLQSVIEIK